MNWIRKILREIAKKENVVPLGFSLVFTSLFVVNPFVFGTYLAGVMSVIAAGVLTVLFSLITILAGFTVVKSLMKIGAGLSLLVFLASSYCAAPRTPVGDSALGGLMVVGLLYISLDFFRSLYQSLDENLDKIEAKGWPWEKVVTIGLYLLLTGFFIWALYQVVNPIILNLCLYR